LHTLFSGFGRVVELQLPRDRSHVFVSFANEDQASDALEAMRGASLTAGGRTLVVKYADKSREDEVRPRHRASVLVSSLLSVCKKRLDYP
jgi:RNA recognition motif-containing protein